MSKKNVVSVRLDDISFQQLQEIQEILEEKQHIKYSYSEVFKSMIAIYHRFITVAPVEEYDAFLKKNLIKALSSMEDDASKDTEK